MMMMKCLYSIQLTAIPDGLPQTGYSRTAFRIPIITTGRRKQQPHRGKAVLQTLIRHHPLLSPTVHAQWPSILVPRQNTQRLPNGNRQFIRQRWNKGAHDGRWIWRQRHQAGRVNGRGESGRRRYRRVLKYGIAVVGDRRHGNLRRSCLAGKR